MPTIDSVLSTTLIIVTSPAPHMRGLQPLPAQAVSTSASTAWSQYVVRSAVLRLRDRGWHGAHAVKTSVDLTRSRTSRTARLWAGSVCLSVDLPQVSFRGALSEQLRGNLSRRRWHFVELGAAMVRTSQTAGRGRRINLAIRSNCLCGSQCAALNGT